MAEIKSPEMLAKVIDMAKNSKLETHRMEAWRLLEGFIKDAVAGTDTLTRGVVLCEDCWEHICSPCQDGETAKIVAEVDELNRQTEDVMEKARQLGIDVPGGDQMWKCSTCGKDLPMEIVFCPDCPR